MKKFLLAALLCIPSFAARVESFSFRSHDDLATLTGEIDYPAAKAKSYPLVVLISGTGLYDRDTLFGTTGNDRDFMFRDLAAALNARGIAVLRYDDRGVSCNPRTKKKDVVTCVDNAVRRGVTPETMRQDILEVYRYAANRPDVDAKRLALLGHSEGTLHIGHLVADSKVFAPAPSPKTLMLLGAVTENPRDLLHWQLVDRFLRVMTWDTNRDGYLTNEELAAGYEADPWFSQLGIPLEWMASPVGYWTRATLRRTLETSYNATRADALTTRETDAYPRTGTVVYSSYRWWKGMFQNSEPIAKMLTHFPGPITFHSGTNDSQTPGTREMKALEKYLPLFAVKPRVRLHADVGHGFSAACLAGPIDSAIRDEIADDLAKTL